MWRRELRDEIALHRAVPTEALLLVVLGMDLDVLAHEAFFRAARHAAECPTYDVACAECARLGRIHLYLWDLFTPVMLALPDRWADYGLLRGAIGRGKRVVDASVRRRLAPLCARFRTEDVHEALVVTLWVARRLLGITHAPGALTAMWREEFASGAAWRAKTLRLAWQYMQARAGARCDYAASQPVRL